MFSISAHGTLGKVLTYKKGAIGNVVRLNVKPKASATLGQLEIRKWFKRGVWTWQNKSNIHGYYYSVMCYGLQEPARVSWERFRDSESLYGYYAFMKRWMNQSLSSLPQYQIPPYYGFCVADEWCCDDLICNGVFHSWGDQ